MCVVKCIGIIGDYRNDIIMSRGKLILYFLLLCLVRKKFLFIQKIKEYVLKLFFVNSKFYLILLDLVLLYCFFFFQVKKRVFFKEGFVIYYYIRQVKDLFMVIFYRKVRRGSNYSFRFMGIFREKVSQLVDSFWFRVRETGSLDCMVCRKKEFGRKNWGRVRFVFEYFFFYLKYFGCIVFGEVLFGI